jgi:hypothetical protein
MKISGPKGPGPTPPVAEPAKKEPAKTEGPSFQDVLQADRTGQAGSVAPTGAVAEVTAKLRAGEVTGAEAVDLLIEAVVKQQVGEVASALRERIRDALHKVIAADPVLSEKIRQLGGED